MQTKIVGKSCFLIFILVSTCIATLGIGILLSLPRLCVDDPSVEVVNNTAFDNKNLETISSKNAGRLTNLVSLTGDNQDVSRSVPVVSPDGKYLAVGGIRAARDGSVLQMEACGEIWVFNLDTQRVNVIQINQNRPVVISLQFSLDSTLLLSNEIQLKNGSYKARLWGLNAEIGKESVYIPKAIGLNFGSDATQLYSVGDNSLVFWNGEPETAFDLIVMSDSKIMAVLTEDGVSIWDRLVGKKLITLSNTAHFRASRVKFSPDGKLLVIVGHDYFNYEMDRNPPASSVQIWGLPAQS